jgi:hypothetical protein
MRDEGRGMKKEKISAEAAIAAGLQLYIVSMVLMP